MPVDNESTTNTGSWTFRPYEPMTFSKITGLEEKRTQKMSEETALRLHLMMWKDMQRELGDRPLTGDRSRFKSRWIERNLPFMSCMHNCFLCEYARDPNKSPIGKDCSKCPVIWDKHLDDAGASTQCEIYASKVKYHSSPISEILALPARNPNLQWIVDEFNGNPITDNCKPKSGLYLSEEMAIRLHQMMWSDMQKDLGDNPEGGDRVAYKMNWVKKNFPRAKVMNDCFLCQCVRSNNENRGCYYCPIEWGKDGATCDDGSRGMNYLHSPISKILALPTRNPKLQHIVDEFNNAQKEKEKIEKTSYANSFSAGYEHYNNGFIAGYEQARQEYIAAVEKMFEGNKNES